MLLIFRKLVRVVSSNAKFHSQYINSTLHCSEDIFTTPSLDNSSQLIFQSLLSTNVSKRSNSFVVKIPWKYISGFWFSNSSNVI